MEKYKHEELTKEIINAAYTVHNNLGYGFLEKVYHNALIVEFRKRQIPFESEKKLTVYYLNEMIGEYFADLIVDGKVIVEVKSAENHNTGFEAQLLNYLKAAKIEVGLLINFAKSVQVKRMVL
ncbi:MAG: GxxExxY protein [Phycisphaerae bacterium]